MGLIARLKEQAGIHSEVVGNVLDAVAEVITGGRGYGDLYQWSDQHLQVPGAQRQAEAHSELISAFEEKQQLT